MKMLVLPKPIEGVSREEMLRHAPAEIQAVWQLYKQGIVREFYTRANEAGRVVLVLESASEEEAREALVYLALRAIAPDRLRFHPAGTLLWAGRLSAARS